MPGGRTRTLKPMKHPKLNGGQRLVGLDQDSCNSKKIWSIRSWTGGNVRWGWTKTVAFPKKSEASEAERGATSGGVGPRQLHFQKNSDSQAEGNQDSLRGGASVRKQWRFVQNIALDECMENIRKPEEIVGTWGHCRKETQSRLLETLGILKELWRQRR